MTHERTVLIPPRLVAAIRSEASRRGRSVSWCIERVWRISRGRLALLAAPTPIEQNFGDVPMIPELQYTHPRAEAIYADRFADPDDLRPLPLTLQVDMLEEMKDESFRLARSLAWLVERAWCLALDVEATGTEWFAQDDFGGETPPVPAFE